MELTPADINDLLREQYPRHINDALVLQLVDRNVPDDPIVLFLDESLWEFATDVGRSAHSMSLALARQLHTQLGQVIDQVDQLAD